MKPSLTCFDLIKRFEGCRLRAYLCAGGVWTIGWGHTKGVKKGDVITQKQADDLLGSEVENFSSLVYPLIKAPVNQNQFDALVSFAYNVGVNALRNSTLLKKLNLKDYAGAAEEFPKWNKAGGKVLNGLISRRAAERNLFLTRPST